MFLAMLYALLVSFYCELFVGENGTSLLEVERSDINGNSYYACDVGIPYAKFRLRLMLRWNLLFCVM